MDRTVALLKIVDDVLALKEGELTKLRRENDYLPVVGEGPADAHLMLIGEAPGEKEAKTGKPFIGRAGKFLDELLEGADIPRQEVYITSIVKDRPPKNRDPRPDEIELYAPFLDRQIEIIRPKVVATLGRFSMQYVMTRYGLSSKLDTISALHGQVFDTHVGDQPVKVIALFHPAAAIYNQALKDTLKEDFKILKTLVS